MFSNLNSEKNISVKSSFLTLKVKNIKGWKIFVNKRKKLKV